MYENNQQSSDHAPKISAEITVKPEEPQGVGQSSEPKVKIEIKIEPEDTDAPDANGIIISKIKKEVKDELDFEEVHEELAPTADNVIKWEERQIKKEKLREERGETDSKESTEEPCMVPWHKRRRPKRGRRTLWPFLDY